MVGVRRGSGLDRGHAPQLVLFKAECASKLCFLSTLSRLTVQITQDLLKARDKRIGVMTELIGAIQVCRKLSEGPRLMDSVYQIFRVDPAMEAASD